MLYFTKAFQQIKQIFDSFTKMNTFLLGDYSQDSQDSQDLLKCFANPFVTHSVLCSIC